MEDVRLEHPGTHIEAKHLNINVRLLPLLLGKIEVSTLDVHDAHFSMRGGLLDPTRLSSLAALPVQRIRLIRARFDDLNGNRLLEDVRLDLRNLGPENEALWEFQAEQNGNSINGHGTLDFRHGEVRGGFGKLKFDTIPLAWLAPAAPASMQQWFDNPDDRLSGALTIDLKENNAWSIFGEVTARMAARDRSVSLRGKLHHPAEEQYSWDDSFIRLDDNAVITTKGQCSQGDCHSSLAANGIPLAAWGSVLPESIGLLESLAGTTDMKASLHWQDAQWQATGDLLLKNGRYRLASTEINLPELFFDQASIAGDQNRWQATASLSIAQAYGKVAIESKSLPAGVALHLESEGIENYPQALVDMLLAALDIEAGLQLSGKLSGDLQFQKQEDRENSLRLSLTADEARIALPSGVEKPAGVAGRCQLAISWPPASTFRTTSFQLEHCRLGNSAVEQLRWDGKQRRFTAGGLAVDLAALRQQIIQPPVWLDGLAGHLTGELAAGWPGEDWSSWLEQAAGSLTLDGFGANSWRASGELKLKGGILASSRLTLRGAYGQAELAGSYALTDRHGKIDILAGELDWNRLPTPAEDLAGLILEGNIQKGRLKLLDNEIQEIAGQYQWRQGALNLAAMRATLAGGQLQSPRILLTPKDAGLSVQGHLRADEVPLSGLTGIGEWLQSSLAGRLHANLDLHGQLPFRGLAEWQYSNGDILIYNGSWRQRPESEPERPGMRRAGSRPFRFSMFSSRFRIQNGLVDISRIKLRQKQAIYSGVAGIDKEGLIHGHIGDDRTKKTFSLEGTWPLLQWQEMQ